MENHNIFQKDGKTKNLLEGWKIENSSRMIENHKMFQKDGKSKMFQKDGKS